MHKNEKIFFSISIETLLEVNLLGIMINPKLKKKLRSWEAVEAENTGGRPRGVSRMLDTDWVCNETR